MNHLCHRQVYKELSITVTSCWLLWLEEKFAFTDEFQKAILILIIII
jgi:hypothetical protein